jgi:hypothetical protein
MQFLSTDKNGVETTVDESDPLQLALKQQGKGVRCRFCQDNHFSAKCPFKDSGLPPMDMSSRITDDSLLDGKKVSS